jgi:hypothetical protein
LVEARQAQRVGRVGSTGRPNAALAVVMDERDPAAVYDILYITNHAQHFYLTA